MPGLCSDAGRSVRAVLLRWPLLLRRPASRPRRSSCTAPRSGTSCSARRSRRSPRRRSSRPLPAVPMAARRARRSPAGAISSAAGRARRPARGLFRIRRRKRIHRPRPRQRPRDLALGRHPRSRFPVIAIGAVRRRRHAPGHPPGDRSASRPSQRHHRGQPAKREDAYMLGGIMASRFEIEAGTRLQVAAAGRRRERRRRAVHQAGLRAQRRRQRGARSFCASTSSASRARAASIRNCRPS